jgi:group II intron reverse transcriptase/maturase
MDRAYYSLYGRLLSREALTQAFRHVKRAKGAAGIDGQSLSDFALQLDDELDRLLLELKSKQYRPQPVRRVEIPKDDGGVRLLGVPTVRDRVVQQALRHVLEPIFDPHFHPSSYGYRKGRSGHQAIAKASLFIRRYKRHWVVDMDLSKCFDRLDHELILSGVRRRVADGSVLALLRLFLSSGVMVGERFEPSELGSPQGGVISPLLANIYLDAFDQYMMARGHRIVRYADDILILCGSKAAAHNALRVASGYLEGELKLAVNESKTHVAYSGEGVKFLGVEILTGYTRIQAVKVQRFQQRVKQLTRRGGGKPLSTILVDLNPVLRGFSQYFRVANCKRQLAGLMAWIRRRLRAIQLKLWKKASRLRRRLRQVGTEPWFKSIKMNSWRNANSPAATLAMRNRWFHEELGLFDMSAIETGVLVPV